MLTKLLNYPAANFAVDGRGEPAALGNGFHHLPLDFEDSAPKHAAVNELCEEFHRRIQ